MARSKEKAPKAPKKPKEDGRIKQMWQVFQMTRRYDKNIVLLLVLSILVPVAIGLVLALLLSDGNGFVIAMWIVAGVLAGVLIALVVLGRRAEAAAYGQIAGQPGAVGAVLRSSLKRSWRGSEMPVAVNGKTQDAVYRAVGRGGVVLISEGPKSRTTRMLEDERRKVLRVLPNVPVTFLYVGPDDDAVPLHKVPARLNRIKANLTKPEVMAVSNRLTSLSSGNLPIPKGVDPMKARPQRGR
ncbi:DUF4191 domain-containing protein [Subtercola boreus]|uniref:DUF4191 domain-containing protein n=1 Tax=Subtercola boreus TaxID=120213 RepID=A0A3E0WC68_9MICO|nr:DUF4191 domain-containing protein [Subtercola boreus]RFA20771.1 hypothetical protein B7R24_08345 [Subtercola boreus]RFA20886.1 hypothetical protein B7R23_08285 [Subtercola boreus]RFA27079.1 hypothetical protein B7R25_08410 [Subtercola boreus]